MSIKFNKEKTIIEILEGTQKEILSSIDLLAKDYLEKTGKKLNKGCPACVIEMLLTLKNHYKMTKFKFKRHAASYKNKKGDTTTISNSTMTDEKAIEFLKENPERIKLFSEFPSNWETLIIKGAKAETDEEKEKRLAIEAEMLAASTLKVKPVKAELLKKKLKELRAEFPMVKENSIKAFIDKVMKLPVEVKAEAKVETKLPEKVEVKEEGSEADAIAEAEKVADKANEVKE